MDFPARDLFSLNRLEGWFICFSSILTTWVVQGTRMLHRGNEGLIKDPRS